MLDIKWIRHNSEDFEVAMKRRGLEGVSEKLLKLDEVKRTIQSALQEKLHSRNTLSKEIGGLKKAGKDAASEMEGVAVLKKEIAALHDKETLAVKDFDDFLASLPNVPSDDVPDGADESENLELRKIGKPTAFSFEPKDHVALGEGLGMMHFDTAAEMSGSRFSLLTGALAKLERALATLFLDVQTKEHDYEEVSPPYLVRDNAVFGVGQLPKFSEDLFQTTSGHWLISTAEVPLTNIAAKQTFEEKDLPKRYTAWTPCFRSEAGAAGRDTRGMIRQHQFSKVEMVTLTTPDQSLEEHERMTKCAETLLGKLGLAYRVVTLCVGDLGAQSRKTYDIEVWLPSQNTYREISSCSSFGDYQARRMRAHYKTQTGEKALIHTLNGSGLPIGRTLVAILENYQNEDGSVAIPIALQPYMDGVETLKPPKKGA